MTTIRTYQTTIDEEVLRDCIVELQDDERSFEPGLPPGAAIAGAYLDFLVRRCRDCEGEILLAVDDDGSVVGFVTVLTRVRPEEPDEGALEYAYVSDLLVRASHRRKGIGRRLLQAAERLAASRGVGELRVGVLARNRIAREVYARLGFTEYQMQLTKKIAPDGAAGETESPADELRWPVRTRALPDQASTEDVP